MDITLQDQQKIITLNPPHILKAAKKILAVECINKASLSVVFVDRREIRALNKKFLRRDHETDVLAFDGSDPGLLRRKPKSISGDIIISTDAVVKNSKEFNASIAEELCLYIIHGILHLCGYDDHKATDIKKMRKRERDILKLLGSSIKHCVK